MDLWGVLPEINATLNGLCAVGLWQGRRAILAGRVVEHRKWMLGCFALSCLFLICYLLRVWHSGTHRFPPVPFVQPAYWVLLATHTVCAMAVVPMVLMTLLRAWREQFVAHRFLARFTWPIWMYVSMTGVLVYTMLYQVAPRLVATGT